MIPTPWPFEALRPLDSPGAVGSIRAIWGEHAAALLGLDERVVGVSPEDLNRFRKVIAAAARLR